MRLVRALVVALALSAFVAACGDDEDAGSSETAGNDNGDEGEGDGDGEGDSSEDPKVQDCIDAAIEALSSFDISAIDPADGLNATEQADLDAQFTNIETEHPAVKVGSECDRLLGANPESRQAVLDGLDADLVTVLTAPINEPAESETFSETGSAIN